VIPLLLFFAPLVLSGWRTRLFVFALVVSVVFALLGAFNPWPPAYEQEAHKDRLASLVTNPVGGNAAAWLEQHFPGSRAARTAGVWFVSTDPALRRSYYEYFSRSKYDPTR
jgi:hypothetical protein